MKDIIMAADRYGVVNLKIEAEANYVSASTFAFNNVVENLHFADAMNCALLKETLMNFIVKNKVEIIEKNILKDAPEGISNDILAAVVRADDDRDRFDISFSVNDLRRECYTQNLDIDGSREMLVSALKDDMK